MNEAHSVQANEGLSLSVLWIIEKVGLERPVARGLQGDFAVRVFATVESYAKLMRFHRGAVADALLVNADGQDPEALKRVMEGVGPVPKDHVVIVHVAGAKMPPPAAQATDGPHQWNRGVDDFRLSEALRLLLHKQRRAGASVLRYRDVTFDFSRNALSVHPDVEPVVLPLKEAQLLKLFLERAGACLSREEITSTVWKGVKVTPRTIDSHVSRLRIHLTGASIGIQSIYGEGYILK